MRRLPLRLPLALVSCAAVAAIAPIAGGVGAGTAQTGVGSVFFVAKSENRNEVHYGISLDAACSPAGSAPVFAYWRMRERGPLAIEPLLSLEVPAYGIGPQQVVDRGERGGRVVVALNALPRRPIAIDSTADGATCRAVARATIAGVAATLTSVFVQLRWPFGVDHLLLTGRSDADGQIVRERLPSP